VEEIFNPSTYQEFTLENCSCPQTLLSDKEYPDHEHGFGLGKCFHSGYKYNKLTSLDFAIGINHNQEENPHEHLLGYRPDFFHLSHSELATLKVENTYTNLFHAYCSPKGAREDAFLYALRQDIRCPQCKNRFNGTHNYEAHHHGKWCKGHPLTSSVFAAAVTPTPSSTPVAGPGPSSAESRCYNNSCPTDVTYFIISDDEDITPTRPLKRRKVEVPVLGKGKGRATIEEATDEEA